MKKLLCIAVVLPMLVLSGFAKPDNAGQVDIYQVRSELLMDATNYTGAFTPEDAANVWANGLVHRSAAMQYTVMTEKLKKQYADSLDGWDLNWVTGQSSPSVQRFHITSTEKSDDNHAKVNLKFEVGSPTIESEYYNASIWLVHESDFWRIEKIRTDKELNPYTAYEWQ